MKIFIFLLGLAASWTLNAQSIYKSSIDNGGDAIEVGTINITYTMGEVNVQELTSGSNHISEGFISLETVQNSIGIEDQLVIEGIDVYPNPTTESIRIEGLNGSVSVTVYDIQGQKVLEKNEISSDQSIDLYELSAGQYMMKIVTSDGLSLHKLTKL